MKKRSNLSGWKMKLVITLAFIPICLVVVIPLWTIFVASFTSDQALGDNGYSLWPQDFTLDSYIYLFTRPELLFRSYGVTLFVTAVGTVLSIVCMTMYAYTLTRKSFKLKKFLDYYILIPMLFSGGTVPYYILVTRGLQLKNTIWILILPLVISPFYVLLLRTNMKAIPASYVEAAKIDGAGEFRIFISIILPLSMAGIATVALFSMLGYWNDMYQALLFIDEQSLFPLQYLLYKLISDSRVIPQGASFVGQQVPFRSVKMAMAVMAILPIMFAFAFVQKYFVKGITLGGIKGD